MANRKTLELSLIELDGRAKAHLSNIAVFDDADIAHFEREVLENRTTCLGVIFDEKRVGTMLVTWVQEDVLICSCNALAVDNVPGFDPVPELVELMRAWCVDRGAKVLRCWTKRRGLVHKLEKESFAKSYVLEAQIDGR